MAPPLEEGRTEQLSALFQQQGIVLAQLVEQDAGSFKTDEE
jgi:hypothetical protein